MCGIIGIIGKDNVTNDIFTCLQHLEYRGYDSAGIAVNNGSAITKVKAEGKLKNLKAALKDSPITGNIGIGHTRWATHGSPNTVNAHPHATEKVAVVHNGIIENFIELRKELESKGFNFTTETDTEVIPKLITYYLDQGLAMQPAFEATLKRLDGAYAICAIFSNSTQQMAIARKGSPLAFGFDEDEIYIASDGVALAPLCNNICYIEDGDYCIINNNLDDRINIYDEDGAKVEREILPNNLNSASVGKGKFRHYMLKEIHEQPTSIAETLHSYYNAVEMKINVPKIAEIAKNTKKIFIIACGTSYYAGSVAKYWLEKYARVNVELDIASEFRYREPVINGDEDLCIFISQSGETADSLAALREAKKLGAKALAIVNVPESSISREADYVLPTNAGPEIGVASTKAFTAQLTALACFTIALASSKGSITKQETASLSSYISEASGKITEILHNQAIYKEIAKEAAKARSILYIGRGTCFPLAMEGALKLKEISYIHAEGYGAGELKHGPIALIDEKMPIVAIAPSDSNFAKTASNIQEVTARGAKVILITDNEGKKQLESYVTSVITIPKVQDFITPIVYSLPIQLLAYYVAIEKGTDVDQPRNLAKSVTVE